MVDEPTPGSAVAEPLALLAGADDAYAMPLAVTLFSALDHLKPGCRVDVYIMDGGIREENRARIERVLRRPPVDLRLEWVQLDPETVRSLPVPPLAYHSVVTNFRLFAPHFVPGPRVIYLDSDVVVRDDLEKLWTLALGDCAVAATLDVADPELGMCISNWREQQLDPRLPYFNAGILVIDLRRWRAEDTSRTLVSNLQTHQKVYVLNDQDALNAVLHNGWLEFGARWNVMVNTVPFRSNPVPVDEVSIIHYTGNFKPWRWLGLGAVKPHYAQFFRALERSRWFSWPQYVGFRVRHLLSSSATVPKRFVDRLRHAAAN